MSEAIIVGISACVSENPEASFCLGDIQVNLQNIGFIMKPGAFSTMFYIFTESFRFYLNHKKGTVYREDLSDFTTDCFSPTKKKLKKLDHIL